MLAHMLGGAALFLCVGSYLMKTHRTLTFTAAAGVMCWALHFAVLGFWTASVLSALMSLRVASAVYVLHMDKAPRWWLTVVAWVLTGAAAWLTWNGWPSVPSTAATLFLAWSGFHLHLTRLRVALLVGEALWFINGYVAGSPVAMTAAALSFALNAHMLAAALRGKEKAFDR